MADLNLSNDTFNELQSFKRRQTQLRERLQRRKREREDILTGGQTSQSSAKPLESNVNLSSEDAITIDKTQLEVIEHKLLHFLRDESLKLPIDSSVLSSHLLKTCDQMNEQMCHQIVNDLLHKFLLQDLIVMSEGIMTSDNKSYCITSIDHLKLINFVQEMGGISSSEEKKTCESVAQKRSNSETNEKESKVAKIDDKNDNLLESLLSLPTIREKQSKQMGEEILALLSKPTAKERSLVEQFRSVGGAQVQEFCQHGTKEECIKANNSNNACTRLHFKKIIQKHTDESLGDCSFLNTCFHMDSCKYVHYEVDRKPNADAIKRNESSAPLTNIKNMDERVNRILFPSQWIKCDLRYFDMGILGKFSVIMADPPWDIHMELPYGTMSDDEMRNLDIPLLQDEGIIFLWVTGRAMELGRECLSLWGYERCDELIWVKTNQLQRIIRTGRTGHWINHGKEHCLVGIKGNPPEINRGLDCDVIVAEVRATSHKPDEIYGIIERLAPGTRKIELFGRQHNTQPNWVTLGNQLDCSRLIEPQLVNSYKNKYPEEAKLYLNEISEVKK